MKKVLWLASWYPSKVQPLNGDFIQRHAHAVSFYQPVHVIFVVKDSDGKFTSDVTTEHFDDGNLSQVIAYYKPLRYNIAIIDRFLSIIKYFRVSLQLIRSFIRKDGLPILVHVHVVLWAGLLALWIKKRYGIHYIVTEHWSGYHKNSLDNLYSRGQLFSKLTKWVLRNADLLLPVSRQLGETIHENFGGVKFEVVPNAVDTNYFHYEEYTPPEFRFIHVSMMNYPKNMEGILNVLGRLQLLNRRFTLIAVGPESVGLRKHCSRLGLDNFVKWKGELSYKQVAEEMKHSSAMVMFSRYENMPCVILEAQCCGLPVIATDVGGIPEVINSENGILVSPGDEDELLAAMVDLMNRSETINRIRIAENAFEHYSYKAVGEHLKSLYNQVIHGI